MLLIYRAKPDQAENTASAQQRKSATQATTAHGNMVATLSKSGQNDYALSNQRSFDAWGNVRIGSASGNPTGRYCANIGHKQDDESGLIYMRARYYEPTSGRFVSEDPSLSGSNWFVYCENVPTSRSDRTGKSWWDDFLELTDTANYDKFVLAFGILGFVRGGIIEALAEAKKDNFNACRIIAKAIKGGLMPAITGMMGKTWLSTLKEARNAGKANGEAAIAITACAIYAVIVAAFVASIDFAFDTAIDTFFPN